MSGFIATVRDSMVVMLNGQHRSPGAPHPPQPPSAPSHRKMELTVGSGGKHPEAPSPLVVYSPSSLLSTASPTPSSSSHSSSSSAPHTEEATIDVRSYPLSSLSSLPSVSSSPVPMSTSTATTKVSESAFPGSGLGSPSRSATVKQRKRRSTSQKPSRTVQPSTRQPAPAPELADADDDDGAPVLTLSQAELDAESKAHHHRLALDRPAFIDKRRAEEERKREERRSRVRRWPYIDARNIARFQEEKHEEQREREALQQRTRPQTEEAEQRQRALAAQQAARAEEVGEGSTAASLSTDSGALGEDELKVSAGDGSLPGSASAESRAEPAERSDGDNAASSPPSRSSPNPATDGDDTDDEEASAPPPDAEAQADADGPAGAQSRSRKKKASAWASSNKSKKRRPASTSSAALPSAAKPPRSAVQLPPAPFPAPVHRQFGHFTPALMLGNRVHFYDGQTRLHRDGDLLEYSPERRAYSVRLDITADEDERGVKESGLMRWLKVEEQEVWEYIDVAWCRHPDRGGVRSWWPCDVVQVYRNGRLVPPHKLRPAGEEPPGDDEEDEDEDAMNRPSVVIHLLGIVEDKRLFPLHADAVVPWSEGLSQGFHTRAPKAMAQALWDGAWTFHYHLQKWVNLEHERRMRSAQEVRSRTGQDWVGRRVAVLWEDDSRWYAGHVVQFNVVTGGLCVLYDDKAVEWVNVERDFVADDAAELPFVLQQDQEQEPIVLDCYHTYHLYDGVQRSLEQWEALIHPPRTRSSAALSESEERVVVQDPTLDETSTQCWECGLVDDVYLLASNMGMRAGKKKEDKMENVTCIRCTKTCHARCFALLCDSLSCTGAEQPAEDTKKKDAARAVTAGDLRGGWNVIVDRKKPRCIDCLRCEHCGAFGAKELRPRELSEEEEAALGPAAARGGEQVLTMLRAPTDFLTCDVCDLRVHRQCVEPAIPDDHLPIDGGWVCRTCLQCRSCGDTQTQMEQPGYARKPREDEPPHGHPADAEADDGDDSTRADGDRRAKRPSKPKGGGQQYGLKRRKKIKNKRGGARASSRRNDTVIADGSLPTASSMTDGPLPRGSTAASASMAAEEGGSGAVPLPTSFAINGRLASTSRMDVDVEEQSSSQQQHNTSDAVVSEAGPPLDDSLTAAANGSPATSISTDTEASRPPPFQPPTPIAAAADDGGSSVSAAAIATVRSEPAPPPSSDDQLPTGAEAVSNSSLSTQPVDQSGVRVSSSTNDVSRLASPTAACPADSQQSQSSAADADEEEDANVDAVVSTSASASSAAAFSWTSWSYAFTMCRWCSQRMRDREYCPICCSIWDAKAMIEVSEQQPLAYAEAL